MKTTSERYKEDLRKSNDNRDVVVMSINNISYEKALSIKEEANSIQGWKENLKQQKKN